MFSEQPYFGGRHFISMQLGSGRQRKAVTSKMLNIYHYRFSKVLFTLKQNSSGLKSVLKLRFSDGRITCSVDGRPNRRNEAACFQIIPSTLVP